MKKNSIDFQDFESFSSSSIDSYEIPQIQEQVKKRENCSECTKNKILLSEAKKSIQTLERKNKILIAQKSELQKEVLSYKNTYNDLVKNRENTNYEEILKRKDAEIKELAEELKKTQELFQEITQEYDSFTMNVSKIENDNEIEYFERVLKEKEIVIKEKENSLLKAQALIKKLNEECEELSQQIFEFEQKKEKNLEIEGLKKKNEDLENELKGIKKKYKENKFEKFEENENFKRKYEIVLEEKQELEFALGELNKKFKEIEEMSTYRLEVFCNTYEKIQDLEEIIEKKDKDFEKLKQYYENLEASRQLEHESLKKSTEMIFKNLKNQQFEIENAENDEKIEKPEKKSLPAIRNLKMLIKELVFQENKLRKSIYLLIDKEGKVLKFFLYEINSKADGFRSDFEKWVMRNEELEQRLVDVERNNVNLVKVIKDLQKIIAVKDKQFEEVVKLYTRNGKEMQAAIDFMSCELNDKQNIIVKDTLPAVYQRFSNTLSDMQIKYFRKTHR